VAEQEGDQFARKFLHFVPPRVRVRSQRSS
jgi:hypothetical protein